MEFRDQCYVIWSLIWILTVNLPPGSKSIQSSNRLNLYHSILSSILSIACLAGLIPESITTTCTLTYLTIDTINIILNDFVWKVPSIHRGINRYVEYFHHILCLVNGYASEYTYKIVCPTFNHNPFVNMMTAEISTPFLIIWRENKSETMFFMFAVLFTLNRMVYQLFFVVPECIQRCHWIAGYGFGVLFDVMNIFFFFTLVDKLIKRDYKKRSQ